MNYLLPVLPFLFFLSFVLLFDFFGWFRLIFFLLRVWLGFVEGALIMVSTSFDDLRRIIQSSLKVIFFTKFLGQFSPSIIHIIIHSRFRLTYSTIPHIIKFSPRSPHHKITMLVLLHCFLLSLYLYTFIILPFSLHIFLFLLSFLLQFPHSGLLRLLQQLLPIIFHLLLFSNILICIKSIQPPLEIPCK